MDRIVISAEAGTGGPGCASFARGPNQDIAPPDGGHGGDGGSVWLEASSQCTSLRMSTHTIKAENGRPGLSAKKKGRKGNDLVIPVPPGTMVHELVDTHDPSSFENMHDIQVITDENPDQEPEKILLCELNQEGSLAIVSSGGTGGRGNLAFKSSQNRSPMNADRGQAGQKRKLQLELKTIADVGLVGFPNAGKSSFLHSISTAKPKIASYPFTTLRPHIGVVNPLSLNPQVDRTYTVADIPGLIEGAHENRGLGHEFLRHIERTNFLVYILDVSVEEETAVRSFQILQNELEMYQTGLSRRSSCIVANKMDEGELSVINLTSLLESYGNQMAIFPISAKFQTGIDDVVKYISESLPSLLSKQF